MSQATTLLACDALIDLHAWDHTKIDPHAWLTNFRDDDVPLALTLLNCFSFYSDQLVDQLFYAAFQGLSNVSNDPWTAFSDARTAWTNFCQSSVVTLVQGEAPNPSDSGWYFARKARQILGFSEDQLRPPGEALKEILAGHTGAVIFVDDFVGSGEQFVRTWYREFEVAPNTQMTFDTASKARPELKFFYCNAMTTTLGRDRIARDAPSVKISAGNIIPSDHSLVSADSVLWPNDLRIDGIAMVERVSKELGYQDTGGDENDWKGFHQLGLGLAFEHSVPDASLPIFFSDRNGWKPLVKRV